MTSLPWVVPLRRPKFTFYRIKVTIPTSIPTQYIYALIYLSLFYIYIGGVYNLLENTPAIGSDGTNPVLIYARLDAQYILEGIVAGLIMFAGAFGLYLLREASSDPYNPDRANAFIIYGVILLITAFVMLNNMLAKKTG